MKTAPTAAAVLTVWLGVAVLVKNVIHVDAFLFHHPRQNMMPSSSSSSSFVLKRTTLSTTSRLTATTTSQQHQQNKVQQLQEEVQEQQQIEWQVYVDQSEASLEKGGSATLDAFLGLAPAGTVQVKAALLPMGSYYAASPSSSGGSNSDKSNNNNNNNSVGPFVRCIPVRKTRRIDIDADDGDDENIINDSRRAFDVCNVDSVDKVYRILTKHMRVQGVTTTACDCLKWKYKANGYLEAGQISLAIEAYDKALEIVAGATAAAMSKTTDNNNNSTTSNASSGSTSTSLSSASSSLHHQEGALYLMRATAYLQRARRLRKELKGTMLKFSNLVSSSSSTSSLSKSHQPVTSTLLTTVAKMAHNVDPLSNNNKINAENGQEKPKEEEKEQTSLLSVLWGGGGSKSSSSSSSSSSTASTNNAAVAALQQSIFRRILRDAQAQEFQFRRTLYMHGLYQHALLQAAHDALYSTELLADYPTAWQQAGDVFSDLWKLPESTLFYQRAIQLDNDDYENDENGNYSSSSSRPQRQRRLDTTLKPVIERLKRRQQLLDQARSYYGWSEDTLRLALDVAATSMKVDLKRP